VPAVSALACEQGEWQCATSPKTDGKKLLFISPCNHL